MYILIGVLTVAFIYALCVNEEYEEELPPRPRAKKYIKVKRNGEWVDEEEK